MRKGDIVLPALIVHLLFQALCFAQILPLGEGPKFEPWPPPIEFRGKDYAPEEGLKALLDALNGVDPGAQLEALRILGDRYLDRLDKEGVLDLVVKLYDRPRALPKDAREDKGNAELRLNLAVKVECVKLLLRADRARGYVLLCERAPAEPEVLRNYMYSVKREEDSRGDLPVFLFQGRWVRKSEGLSVLAYVLRHGERMAQGEALGAAIEAYGSELKGSPLLDAANDLYNRIEVVATSYAEAVRSPDKRLDFLVKTACASLICVADASLGEQLLARAEASPSGAIREMAHLIRGWLVGRKHIAIVHEGLSEAEALEYAGEVMAGDHQVTLTDIVDLARIAPLLTERGVVELAQVYMDRYTRRERSMQSRRALAYELATIARSRAAANPELRKRLLAFAKPAYKEAERRREDSSTQLAVIVDACGGELE